MPKGGVYVVERVKRNASSVSTASLILERIVVFFAIFTGIALLDWLALCGFEWLIGMTVGASTKTVCLEAAKYGLMIIAGVVALFVATSLVALIAFCIGCVIEKILDRRHDHHNGI